VGFLAHHLQANTSHKGQKKILYILLHETHDVARKKRESHDAARKKRERRERRRRKKEES
jgi:hypothetical protein